MENFLASKFGEDKDKLIFNIKNNIPFWICGEQGFGKNLFKKNVLDLYPNLKIETTNEYVLAEMKGDEIIHLCKKIEFSEVDELIKALKEL